MKKKVNAALILLVSVLLSSFFTFAEDNSFKIMQNVNNRNTGTDSIQNIIMIIKAKGIDKIREFTLWQKKQNSIDYIKIAFLKPADIKGTTFLTISSDTSEKVQWIYLPSMKKTIKIAASDKNKPFMGSDLSYDDFGKRDLNSYTYSFLGETDINSKSCYIIQSIPVNDFSYSKIVSYVQKDTDIIVKAEFFNKSERLVKVFTVKTLELLQNIWTIKSLIMENVINNTSTELNVQSVKYNSNISASIFSKDMIGK